MEVAGRGELQLGVLIETMRREGYELAISRPRVLFRPTRRPDSASSRSKKSAEIDLDEGYAGIVVEKLALRKAEMTDMRPSGGGKQRLTFIAPTRGLIGYQGEFMTDTRGTGIMSRLFHGYAPWKGSIEGRRNGVLISTGEGRRRHLCAVEPRRARPDVHRAGNTGLSGHDHRRAHARQRSRRQPDQRQQLADVNT